MGPPETGSHWAMQSEVSARIAVNLQHFWDSVNLILSDIDHNLNAASHKADRITEGENS